MRYQYFVTSEVQAYINKKNVAHDIDVRLADYLKLDVAVKTSVILKNLVVSKEGDGLRFVWFMEIRPELDACIYVLRRIYRHDEYLKKINEGTRKIWYDRHQLSQKEAEELNAEFAKYTREEKKEELPEVYRKYEDSRAFDKDRDVIFYEMPLWHDGMKKVPEDYWPFIQQALFEGIQQNFQQLEVFMYHTTNNYTITYRFGTPNAIKTSDVYLLQIVKGSEPNLDELLERNYDCSDVADLQNFSSKCYPDYYTCEYESWKEVEKDDMANLALSEEEIKILQKVQFPFFVSGLAGSGKSTILYYLYANIYKYMSENHPEHKLLFLSYNDTLVDKARMSVRSILSYHYSNLGFKAYFEDEKNAAHFNNSFIPFREFLKNTFLDEDSLSLFSEDRHITYEKFRELYRTEYKQSNRHLSPSILWSVIRTFIKGRRLDPFTPKDYDSDAISRRDRTVGPDIYQEAYKIWNNWYRHYAEEYTMWDDLDLVRYSLTHGDFQNAFHDYSVIFCDEAQDFTKLEIDLILNLSKHSKYMLSAHPEDQRIPIAFAGDPNQTISPTGFRWAGTKAIFNKSFEDSLDKFPELSDPELSKNYRSQLGIVKFANTIQTIRYNYFDENSKDRKLQSVREDPKGDNKDALEYASFYSYTKHKSVILENLTNANIITSGDGEEGDLSCFPDIKDDKVKLSTAVGTKGLEYNAVMLLNFSTDPAYKLFQKIIHDEPFLNDSERFEAAHFFTKLYIAISRAKYQLFVVDTDESYENFWKYFTEQPLWEELINRFVNDEEKRKLVGRLCEGNIDTLPQRLSDSYDAEANGRQVFERAKGTKSVADMKLAHSYFSEAGLTALADQCDAYIYLYSNEYKKAGDKFNVLKFFENAKAAYWTGACWEPLANLISSKHSHNYYDRIRLMVSRYMIKQVSYSEFLQEMVDGIDDFQNALTSYRADQPIWKMVLDRLHQDLSAIGGLEISGVLTNNIKRFSNYIPLWYGNSFEGILADLYFKQAEFQNSGFTKDDIAFRREGYGNAITIWEQNGLTYGNRDYAKAKKLFSKTPSEEIHWMSELKEVDAIVEKYGDASYQKSLNDEASGVVFNCLLSKDYSRAVAYPYPKDIHIKWNRLYNQNRAGFLLNVVLDGFSEEKFYFLSDKIHAEEENVFESKLPKGYFDLIFSLQENDNQNVPYWTYFTSILKGKNDDRIIKSGINRLAILESLSDIIKSAGNDYDKALASCFIEMLFDKEYNYKRTETFVPTLRLIFGNDVFFKEDFRRITERNKYFIMFSKLESDELDTMKDNVRSFVDTYLMGVKRVSSINRSEIKALLHAYEICVPYQSTNPDYGAICKAYTKFKKNDRLLELRDWMEQRMLLNEFMDSGVMMKASFAKLKEQFSGKGYDIARFVDYFYKEDAAGFVAITLVGKDDYTFDKVLISSKLIYQHHLRRDNLRPFVIVNDLIAKLPEMLDRAIDEVLDNKEHVDEYAIKILTYTWEALYEHGFVASHYDSLVARPRLARVFGLLEYLKKRALLHYSYLKDKQFEEKQNEYGIRMDKSYMPVAYPRIEEKRDSLTSISDSATATFKYGEDISSTEVKKGKGTRKETDVVSGDSTSSDDTTKSAKKTAHNKVDSKKEAKSDTPKTSRKKISEKAGSGNASEMDPQKQMQLEIARSMKANGEPIEKIIQYLGLLTVEDIKKL